MQLYIVRHAQSINNARNQVDRLEDSPLTDLGHLQARQLAAFLRNKEILHLASSPFLRALETAHYIGKATHATVTVCIDLHEQGGCVAGSDLNNYQSRRGLSRTEILEMFPQIVLPNSIDETGWWRELSYETMAKARVRACLLATRIRNDFALEYSTACLVTHATIGQMLLDELIPCFFESQKDRPPQKLKNCAITKCRAVGGLFVLDYFNSISHLSSDLISE